MLEQRGQLRATAEGSWTPFSATETFGTQPISLYWRAFVRQNPAVFLTVSDSYENGHGASAAKLYGVIPLGTQRGTPEVDSASLLRFLAESPWLPTMMGDPRIVWNAGDERSARATLRDGGNAVSADFTFGESGEVTSVTALRYRDVNGTPVLTPWRGHFADYEPIERMMIPTTARVEWMPAEGAFEVWRGHITDARYT